MIVWVLPPPSDSEKAFEETSFSFMKRSQRMGHWTSVFHQSRWLSLTKGSSLTCHERPNPCMYWAELCHLSGCEREMEASRGILGVQVCSLPSCGVTKSLLDYHWSLENTYLLIPETHFSPNPCSFWQYASGHSPDILTGCLVRCPLQWFMDSPPPLVKITFVKISGFSLGYRTSHNGLYS